MQCVRNTELPSRRSHSVPALRWQQVALDIMTHRGKDYLVAVDYLSKFPEIALLERKTAACVIMHLKSMFARHGIADHLMSDKCHLPVVNFRHLQRNGELN